MSWNWHESPSVNFDHMFDPPDEHENDDCGVCHEAHVSEGDVAKNALGWPAQFPCCVEELAVMIEEGKICPVKPKEHKDIYLDAKLIDGKLVFEIPARCMACEHEKICSKPDHKACP